MLYYVIPYCDVFELQIEKKESFVKVNLTWMLIEENHFTT